jgi:hypothetical protein
MDKQNLFGFPLRVMSFIAMPNSLVGGWKGILLKVWFTVVIIDASFGVSTYFHNMMSHTGQLDKFVEAAFPVLSGIFAWTKLMTFIRKQKLFQELADDLKDLIKTNCLNDKDSFVKTDQFCNKVIKVYAVSMMMTMINATIKNVYEYIFYSIREFQFKAS